MFSKEDAHFYARGKLLLTGEYFVLDGSLAIGLPTKSGQHLSVKSLPGNTGQIYWTSREQDGSIWFQCTLDMAYFNVLESTDPKIAQTLSDIFKAMEGQSPFYWTKNTASIQIETQLEFKREWGLGTSSTLIVNLSRWRQLDPFRLLADTFSGSGYDIACGLSDGPLFYQIKQGKPDYQSVSFSPPFEEQLYFIYLGKKQNSRSGIALYKEKGEKPKDLIRAITSISKEVASAKTLTEFEYLIQMHEDLVASYLQLKKVKDIHFSDYWGTIKSLGAWGGDFILATSSETPANTRVYFEKNGYPIIFPYRDLIFCPGSQTL